MYHKPRTNSHAPRGWPTAAPESEARSAGTRCVRRTMVPGRGLPLLWLFGDQGSTTLSHEGTPSAVTGPQQRNCGSRCEGELEGRGHDARPERGRRRRMGLCEPTEQSPRLGTLPQGCAWCHGNERPQGISWLLLGPGEGGCVPRSRLTWITTRGDWEKYQSGIPNRLMSAVLVSYVSEQRVLRTLPPESRVRG